MTSKFFTFRRASHFSQSATEEMHHLEQQAMLRHPNVVRATLAAELSWKLGASVELAQLESQTVELAASSGSSELEEVDLDRDLAPKPFAAQNMFGDGYRNYENSSRQDKVGGATFFENPPQKNHKTTTKKQNWWVFLWFLLVEPQNNWVPSKHIPRWRRPTT